MKIIDTYHEFAKQMFLEAEVDDDKIIKYKKEDGEQGEMKASSAKTMPKDHPAKVAYDKMSDSDSDDKSKGQGLSGSDFDRDEDEKDDKPNTDGDNAKKTDDMQANVGKEYGVSAMDIYDNSQEPEDFDSWDEYESHLNDVAKKLKDKGRKDPFDDEEDDDVEISDSNSGPIDLDDISDMLKKDPEVMEKLGMASSRSPFEMYWDGTDLVSDKFDDRTVASIPDDANMTLGDLKKQIMDFEPEDEGDDTAGDPDDSWDDEEGRAKPMGKTDADTDDDPRETKVINGVKYRAIKESKEPTKQKTFVEKVKENSKRFAKRK
tara:strand:- start:68 stop:1024 length:957 start_codon:yes stop_codon:yes gene_type:complete